MERLDRKGKEIHEGDIVALDLPVHFGVEPESQDDEIWDIVWGVAEKSGIRIELDPFSSRENVLYNYSEDPNEMMVIKRKDFSVPVFDGEVKVPDDFTQEELDYYASLEEDSKKEFLVQRHLSREKLRKLNPKNG